MDGPEATMISPTGNNPPTAAKPATPHGFTLIELILVMAVLAIVAAVAVPQLKGFFKGRNLDAEARRFLALTRRAQERAISESTPMTLWINPTEKTYGLEMQVGQQVDPDPNALEFKLHDQLEIEADYLQTKANAQSLTTVSREPTSTSPASPEIIFLPDGFPTMSSPQIVWIREPEGDVAAIALSQNRLRYEILTNTVRTTGR